MTNYVRMYAVPKEKYDAFLSGACKGDIKYTRQINQLDVNDGGKVIIRNDDNNKKTTNISQPQVSSPREMPDASERKSEEDVRMSHSYDPLGEREGSNRPPSPDTDFSTLEERFNQLKNPYVADTNPPSFDERLSEIRKNYKLPDPTSQPFNEPEIPTPIPASQTYPKSMKPPQRGDNSINETAGKEHKSLPPEISFKSARDQASLPPMRVTSDNPPRVFTPVNELNSSRINRFPPITHEIQSISEEPISSMEIDPDFSEQLNALPDEFFYQSPIRDYNDVINELDWTSNTNELSNDIFDSPMEDLDSTPPISKASRKKGTGIRSKFKSPSSRGLKNARVNSPLNVLRARKPIRSNKIPIQMMDIEPSYQNDVESSLEGSNVMNVLPGKAIETQEIKNVKLPAKWQALIKERRRNSTRERKNSLSERKASRLERQSEFNERRGPRAIQNFSSSTPLDATSEGNNTISLVSKKRTPRSRAQPSAERQSERLERRAEFNERRGPRVASKQTESFDSSRNARALNRDMSKGEKIASIPSNPKVRVKIGEPQSEMVSIFKKKKSLRKRDHSPEMQVVFTKTQPVKRKKDDESEDSDGDYKMWIPM